MTDQPPTDQTRETPVSPPPAPPPPPPSAPPAPPAPPLVYQSPPPKKGSAWRWGCGIGLAGCLFVVMLGILLVLIAIMGALGGVDGLEAGGGDRIALIRIEGVIVAGQSGYSMFGGGVTGSDDVVDELERAAEDDTVKGVLLRINSPGGSAAGSQEIYAAINRTREAGKVVVASVADVAASGGYYVAAPADAIYADAASVTGSIGAIAIHENMAGLFEKIGLETEIIKSGKLKDMGQPTGPLSEDARQVIAALIDEVFSQFVDDVAAGRGMKRSAVAALADGRIYSGAQAQANGLIDTIGGYHEALMEAGRLAGIEGKPQIKEYGAPSFLRMLLDAGASSRPQPVAVTGGLLYDEVAARLAAGGLPAPVVGLSQPPEAR